jgi:hypothetical protein
VTRPTLTGKLSHWPVQEIDDQNTPKGKSNIEREEGHKQKTHKNFEKERKAKRTNNLKKKGKQREQTRRTLI